LYEEHQSCNSGGPRAANRLHKTDPTFIYVNQFQLEPEAPIMAKNAPPGVLGSRYVVQTNAFGVQLEKPMAFWRYDVVISAEIGSAKRPVFFTKKGRDEYVVVFILSLKNIHFFDDPDQLWYDGQSILFSGKDLFKNLLLNSRNLFIITEEPLNNVVFFLIRITNVFYCFQMSLTEKELLTRTANSDLSQNDRSITQFMELVFNQMFSCRQEHAVFENGKVFMSHPWNFGFHQQDCPSVGGGKRLFPGTQKSVRFIEGPGGRNYNNPALIIDAKKAAFHEELPLIEKAKHILNDNLLERVTEIGLERLNAGMKGYLINISDVRVNEFLYRFEDRDGRRISVRDYFEEKYKIRLLPMQRVTIPQQTPDQSQKATRSCAVPPGERQDNIARGARALKLLGSDDNPFVSNAGLYIYKDPIKVSTLKCSNFVSNNLTKCCLRSLEGNSFHVCIFLRMVTMENILLKANLKLGGLNYEIDMNGNWIRLGRLFLGIGVSHPPPSQNFDERSVPSVVGYAANFKANSYDFVGDYLFQSSRREEVGSLTVNINPDLNVLPKFAQNHGNKFPRDLIIYRSGLSEGSFSTILTHEIPLLRGALAALGAKNVKIVFIVAQKEHNVRLMLERIDRTRRPTEQNIPPGVVVDEGLTHPSFKEFYLNSHITLQGSARTPRYTVLVDDLNLSMDELEGMTYVLTYDHQIVNLPTSLPTPLYVANRYAERGRNTYARLSYNNTSLCNIRVNA
uniref:Piwi domain-containing protein n=1 Tax=Haemonchus placei TaxID=6290 RepID=A0A158QKI6_HAEPC